MNDKAELGLSVEQQLVKLLMPYANKPLQAGEAMPPDGESAVECLTRILARRMDKIKVLTWGPKGQGNLTEKLEEFSGTFMDELRGSSPGDCYEVRVGEMSAKDFESLPEFSGF